MTGYGTADGPLGGGRLAVEVRAVNHRHFNAQLRLPAVLQQFEAEVRGSLRKRVERGHVALTARWTEELPRTGSVEVDVEHARAVQGALSRLKDALGLSDEVDLAFIARQPEVLKITELGEVDLDGREFVAIVDRAVDGVLAMREQEGEALGRDLLEQLDQMEQELEDVERRAPQRLVAARDRLRRVVDELLAGHALDESRLAAEVALLAEKLDISEEIVRLRAHMAAARQGLRESGAVGRKLAFLSQEMLREVNTIGSKANDTEIARAVIAIKAALDRFKEQVENVE